MSKEDIKKICDYIIAHRPLGTDFETIKAAINAVGGANVRAITKRELMGEDSWMLPEEERGLFAGISDGAGAYQGFAPSDIQMIMDAVQTSKNSEHFLSDNPKLAEMDLPKIEKIDESFLTKNENLNKIDPPEMVRIGENLETDYKPINKIPEYPNDLESTKMAGIDTSIRRSEEPIEFFGVQNAINNNLNITSKGDGNITNKNTELKAMIEDNINKDVPREPVDNIYSDFDKPDDFGFNK